MFSRSKSIELELRISCSLMSALSGFINVKLQRSLVIVRYLLLENVNNKYLFVIRIQGQLYLIILLTFKSKFGNMFQYQGSFNSASVFSSNYQVSFIRTTRAFTYVLHDIGKNCFYKSKIYKMIILINVTCLRLYLHLLVMAPLIGWWVVMYR